MGSPSIEVLDQLLETLESAASKSQAGNEGRKVHGKDAIDAVLESPRRKTAVSSLRESPEVAAFRQAVVDGLIRVDTANRLLRLVNNLIEKLFV